MISFPFVEKQSETFSKDLLNRIVETIEILTYSNRPKGKNTVVSITGGSCTGKSTILSQEIMSRLLIPYTFLNQDTFQNNASYQSKMDPKYRWDHPDNFAIEACKQALTKLKRDKEVKVPDYSFKTDRPIGTRHLNPKPIILFEGLYAAHQELSTESDLVIYLEAPFYVRLIRRIFRNTLERYNGRDPALILNGFITSVMVAHHDFVRSQRRNADMIIKMPFQFTDLISRFSLSPINKKATFDWCIALDKNLQIALHSRGIFSLIYEEKPYLEFEIDNDTFIKLKQMDWFAL